MAQTQIVNSISRSDSFPVSATLSASYNCGTLMLILSGTWTEQMVCELPALNCTIYIDSDTILQSFNVNMRTVLERSTPADPYCIPVYDIPSQCIIKVSPLFDNNAIIAHNDMIETGVGGTDGGIIWTTPTQTFDLTLVFDNANIKSGNSSGGGGGGGSSDAKDISFNNLGTSLASTNVQDAIVEVANKTSTSATTNATLYANSWDTVNRTYAIPCADITSQSDIFISLPSNTSDANYNAIAEANIVAQSQSTGQVVVKAVGTIPTIDTQLVITVYNKG
jgi:hypothetical protein